MGKGKQEKENHSHRELSIMDTFAEYKVQAEIDAFQQHLSPQYQLKVISRQKPFFIIYRGPEAPNILRLLKSGEHYEGAPRIVIQRRRNSPVQLSSG